MSLISYLLGGAAAILMGFSKTGMPGAAILAVTLMALAFPQQDAKLSVGAMLPLLLVGDLFALAYYRRHAQWGRLLGLFPYVLAGMIPAVLVLRETAGAELRGLLGGLVLSLLALEVCRQWLGWTRMPEQWWFAATMGFLAGFGTALGNAAGPVMGIYLVSRGLQKEQFLGTCAWFFFLVNLAKVPVFCWQGMITPETLRFDLAIVGCIVLGALTGVRVLPKIPQRLFNTLVLALAGAAAVRLIAG